MSRAPKFLAKDGMLFDTPIDFQQMVASVPDDGVELESFDKKADLVKGMLRSDGISVFSDHGRLLGYRCFISTSQPAGVIGGARKRAFFTLTKHLRRGLSAVLVQSQDGATQFEEASNG